MGEPPLWTFSEAARAIAARRRRRGARAVALPAVRRPRASYRSGCNSQRWYTETFNAAFPGVAGILAKLDGVFVAGAAANWPIASDKRGGPGLDVDFFIVGDPANLGPRSIGSAHRETPQRHPVDHDYDTGDVYNESRRLPPYIPDRAAGV